MSETKGRCHCGAVSFDIHGPMRGVIECYCESCRRISGGLWHGTAAKLSNIEIHDAAGALTWYRSSDKAQRGFCNRCGSSLFYRRDGGDRLVIAGGNLEGLSGLALVARIFTGESADYGNWQSEAPTFEAWPPPEVLAVPDAD